MDNARNNGCGCSELIAAILVNDCNSSRSANATGEDSSFSLILSLLLRLLNDHSLFSGEMRCICAGLRLFKWHTGNTHKECCRMNILATTSLSFLEHVFKKENIAVKWLGALANHEITGLPFRQRYISCSIPPFYARQVLLQLLRHSIVIILGNFECPVSHMYVCLNNEETEILEEMHTELKPTTFLSVITNHHNTVPHQFVDMFLNFSKGRAV